MLKMLSLVLIALMSRQGSDGLMQMAHKDFTFLFMFSNKMLVIMAVVRKLLIRIANRDPDQAAISEAV